MIVQDESHVLGDDVARSVSNHLRKQIQGGQETDDGATFKPAGRELSRGCQEACKGGGWICLFLSYECSFKCHFCTTNHSKSKDGDASWGTLDAKYKPTPENLKKLAAIDKGDIKGISFSGGESFLQLDKTVRGEPGIYEWLDAINEIDWYDGKRPYVWMYTSGHYVTEANVQKLVDKGMDEIRFDLAATNYSEAILKKMEMVRGKVNKLSVEIPVLGWQIHRLLGSLKRLDEIGVDYINLHELQPAEGNAEYLVDSGLIDYKMIYSIGKDKSCLSLGMWDFYLPSLIDTYTVIRYIEDNNLNLIYNDCSGRNYKLQWISALYLDLKLNNHTDRELHSWPEYLANYKKMNRIML